MENHRRTAWLLVLQIAVLTAVVEISTADFFPDIDLIFRDLPLFSQIFTLLGTDNHEAHEALISSLILIFLAGPVIYIGVIGPYNRKKEQQNSEIRKIFVQHEGVLLEQKRMLEEAVARATENLKKGEERYALAALGANDGLWDFDLVEDSIFYSDRWKEIIGFHGNEIGHAFEEWYGRVHDDDKLMFKSMIEESKTEGELLHRECEYRMRAKDDTFRWVLSRWMTVLENNKAVRMVGSQTDITDRKRMESQLIHDALHDNLTRLPNRALLNDRLKQAVNRYHRYPDQKFALLLLDLDNFKRINDTLGHTAGDKLLIEIANRLTHSVRSSDTVARLGGDEFAILLEEYDGEEKFKKFMDRLFNNLTKSVKILQSQINPSMSVGVVITDKHHRKSTFEEIISDADLALYQAKDEGKGRHAIFHINMRSKISKQFEIGNNLKGAVERGEISLFYQPIINLQTSQIAGFEGLIRGHHPKFGYVPPLSFIPIAEESHVINELGKFALEEGTRQLSLLQKQFHQEHWFISINVSPRQFDNNELTEHVHKSLVTHKIKPENLCLEVTETLLMSYGDRAVWTLNQIKKMGVKLAIDDFGVGYSSLSTLYKFPFDTLKIDRSFIQDIVHNTKSQDMVRLVSMIGKALGMHSMAEGIELQEQFDFLKSLGNQFGQGFYMSKPRSSEELLKNLSAGLDYRDWSPIEEEPRKSKTSS